MWACVGEVCCVVSEHPHTRRPHESPAHTKDRRPVEDVRRCLLVKKGWLVGWMRRRGGLRRTTTGRGGGEREGLIWPVLSPCRRQTGGGVDGGGACEGTRRRGLTDHIGQICTSRTATVLLAPLSSGQREGRGSVGKTDRGGGNEERESRRRTRHGKLLSAWDGDGGSTSGRRRASGPVTAHTRGRAGGRADRHRELVSVVVV